MEYSNSQPPENINVTDEHPLKEFFILAGGILGGIVAIVVILSLLAEALAPYIPFSMEQELASQFITAPDSENETEIYLQSLADELIKGMDIPKDMSVTVHYVEDEVENAFATLGGNIFIHKGLLDMLPHENALAMVMAHEIAHLQHRHPVIAMGRGVVIGLFLSAMVGLSGDRIVGSIISDTGMVAILSFNRDQERQADITALAALQRYYGHVAGADELFKTLITIKDKHGLAMPQFLSTHPLSEERIKDLHTYANEQGWQLEGRLTELPDISARTES